MYLRELKMYLKRKFKYVITLLIIPRTQIRYYFFVNS